jgi:hypothetical protein
VSDSRIRQGGKSRAAGGHDSAGDALSELVAPRFRALVLFAAFTGLR